MSVTLPTEVTKYCETKVCVSVRLFLIIVDSKRRLNREDDINFILYSGLGQLLAGYLLVGQLLVWTLARAVSHGESARASVRAQLSDEQVSGSP